MSLWRRIEAGCLQSPPGHLRPDDECFFAREYLSWRDYKASEANSLIKNFKIKPTVANYPVRLKWKRAAVQQFAQELADFLPRDVRVCHIPTSKLPDDPEYDPRFDMLLRALHAQRQDLRIEQPFTIANSHQAAHEGGDRAEFAGQLRWRGLHYRARDIVVLDDVITGGTHFKACQNLLLEHGVEMVVGVFWAVAVTKPEGPEIDFSALLGNV